MSAAGKNIESRAVSGALWSAIDRFGVMALQFVVNLVLTQMLLPVDFGMIGMLTIFIAISSVFIDSGFGSALIQQKSPTDTDYSTIFVWNLAVSVVCYAVLFVTSPLIAEYYRMPQLSDVLRVLGISLGFNALMSVQYNRLQKQLQFRTLALSNILSYVISAALAIAMAHYGWGVWSLVMMTVLQPLLRSIIMSAVSRWLPRLRFSIESYKRLVSFGGYIFLSFLLETICRNLQGLLIGRKFSASQMGYYTQADKLNQVVSYSMPQVIASVMYPVFAQYQDDHQRLRELVKFDLRVISFVIFPVLTLLIVVAHPVVNLLYGPIWDLSATYFQILCVGGFAYSLNNIPYYAVAACGKSRALFIVSFYKWSVLAALLFVGVAIGMNAIMWAMSLGLYNIFVINSYLAKKYVGINASLIIGALWKVIVSSALSGAIAWVVMDVAELHWIVASIVFALSYAICSITFNREGIRDLVLIFKKIIPNK